MAAWNSLSNLQLIVRSRCSRCADAWLSPLSKVKMRVVRSGLRGWPGPAERWSARAARRSRKRTSGAVRRPARKIDDCVRKRSRYEARFTWTACDVPPNRLK